MTRRNVRPDEPTEILPLRHAHSVLCVDDEPAVLAALRRSLRGEPYDVLATESPGTALEFVERREISLVLADFRLPQMSGVEMLRLIHQCSPATAGVILTGFPESLSLAGCFGSAVQRVLLKPWDNRLLVSTLRELLEAKESPKENGGHP